MRDVALCLQLTKAKLKIADAVAAINPGESSGQTAVYVNLSQEARDLAGEGFTEQTFLDFLDESVLSNPGHMVLLIISIPVGHLWFATALQRSKTLFFPIGLHLGNNWATRHLISDNGNGESILVVLERVNFETWPSFIGMLLITNGVFLLVALLIWKVGK